MKLAARPTGTATMLYSTLAGGNYFRVAQITGLCTHHELWLNVDDPDGEAVYIVVPESGEFEALKRWYASEHEVQTFALNNNPMATVAAMQYVLDQVEHELRYDDVELTSYSLDEPHHPC